MKRRSSIPPSDDFDDADETPAEELDWLDADASDPDAMPRALSDEQLAALADDESDDAWDDELLDRRGRDFRADEQDDFRDA